MSFSATYFDGVRAVAHPASVYINDDTLLIMLRDGSASLTWDYDALDSAEKVVAGKPVTLSPGVDQDARLIVDDPDFAAAIIDKAPRLSRTLTRRSLKKSEAIMIAAACVAILLLATIFIPTTNKYIAKVLPHALEKRLAQQTKALLIQGSRVCQDTEAQKIIDDLSARLTRAHPVPHLKVRIVDIPWMNAFALAGGEVFFTQGIMKEFNSGDQFAGVLAHEIAHQVESHPGQSLLRALGLQFIVQVFLGDDTVISNVGGMAVLFAFSREMERDADAIAVEMLQAAGITPDGLADFFDLIDRPRKDAKADEKKAQKSDEKKDEKKDASRLKETLSYFSTHPLTSTRKEFVRRHGGGKGRAAMSSQDWQKLKGNCTAEFKKHRPKKQPDKEKSDKKEEK